MEEVMLDHEFYLILCLVWLRQQEDKKGVVVARQNKGLPYAFKNYNTKSHLSLF